MTTTDWLAYFRQNRHDRLPIAWDKPKQVTSAVRAGIAQSVARFQLGESATGHHLRRAADRVARRTSDPAYAEAIRLLIAEEQEHARLLGLVLERIEAPRLHHHWSDWFFRRCRHRFGFIAEISMLLMAEIVALKYYSAVCAGTTDDAVHRVCEQILHDEKFHIRFHCETLHRWLAGRSRLVQWWGWRILSALFAVASTVVAWDHRSALEAFGSSAEDFLDESWRNFAAARQAIFTGEAFVWSRTLRRVVAPVTPPPRRSDWELAWALCVRSWRGLGPVNFPQAQPVWPGRH